MMPPPAVCAAASRRFPGVARLCAAPAARRAWRLAVWGFWFVYFAFVALILILRYGVLPNIESYRPAIERMVSEALGQSVGIGRIEASWDGVNPDLDLYDVRILDGEGRPALAFSRVEAILSWLSLPSAKLKLRLLRIDQPTLNLRRDAAGHFFIAGIPLSAGNAGDEDIADWLFAQRRIRIHDATLIWEDDLRQAPPLRLESLNFGLDNFGWRRRFGLTAQPPSELAAHIDVRGSFDGNDIDRLADWTGSAFAEIDYVDLAAWQRWIDYPIDLPRGRGALRAWAGIERGALKEMTADLLLRDVSIRLGRDLPRLDVDNIAGRVAVELTKNGFAVDGRGVELDARQDASRAGASAESIRIEPTDFHVIWRASANGTDIAGNATASRLDLGALSRLATHLPLDAATRRLLNDYWPQGRIADLSARWKGDAERLQTYVVKARFDGLALKAQGHFPGFSGLSGGVDANEKGGSVSLSSGQGAHIDLPGVFPASLIELDRLKAQAKWKIAKNNLEVDLSRIEFSGPDAAGSAAGVYRKNNEGPGAIDLKAALTRGEAKSVWRYMPHVVGDATRHWLRDSLLAGKASEAKLTLKGDLADFPFRDKSKGQFLVTAKAEDVVLDYAKGWPRVEKIHGNLRFEGASMVIDAQRGMVLGAKLANTRAEIPDLDATDPIILIKGQADGPTNEFLKFIDQSPVAERIDRFTEGMRASGSGHLDIALKIPLDEKKLDESKVDGDYRFQNNDVVVDSALPPLRQVNGNVQFSGSDLRLPEINATLFGGPLKIKGGLQKDGRVLISINGTANVEQLRKQSDLPLLSRLSGTTSYRGEVRINKRDADLIVDSALLGIASSLPEPFAKTANESWPMHFEKRLLSAATPTGAGAAGRGRRLPQEDAAVRDQVLLSLGQVLSLQAIRRKQKDGFVVERAALGLGRTLPLPEKGIAVAIGARRLDLDVWRALLTATADGQGDEGGEKGGNAASAVFMPDALSLKTADLRAFGQSFKDVDLSAVSSPGQWKIRLDSRQASGDLQWDSAGRGKLTARLKRLTMAPAQDERAAESQRAMNELPALDVVAEEFRLGERRFGRLELQASNEKDAWQLSKIQMSNPYGTLTGRGRWLTLPGQNQTQLDFEVGSADVGKLLDQLGYPGAVRGATSKLEGSLGWKGSPADFDAASLNGNMALEVAQGQFLKIKPGAGKLLGLISLQSLPRRITLDFRDIFSEGFAFDSIEGRLSLQNGTMRTDRLQIDGPAARVLMRGETDLKRETQRLNVTVQPELGGTAALGVALINPVAGVATLLANKILRDPLGQMFSFDYLVTGTWDDPKVEKLSKQTLDASSASAPRLPNLSNPETNNAPFKP